MDYPQNTVLRILWDSCWIFMGYSLEYGAISMGRLLDIHGLVIGMWPDFYRDPVRYLWVIMGFWNMV